MIAEKLKVQLERRILGAILLEASVYPRVGDLLLPEDFTSLQGADHSEIFAACAELYPERIINTWAVDDQTKRRYSVYLRELTAPVCSSVNVPHEILQLQEINILSDLRALLQSYLDEDHEEESSFILRDLIQSIRYDSILDSIRMFDEVCMALQQNEFPLYMVDSVHELRLDFQIRFEKTSTVCQATAAIFNLESLASIPQKDLEIKEVQRVLVDWILCVIANGSIDPKIVNFILTYNT